MTEEQVKVYGYGLLVIYGGEPAALQGYKDAVIQTLSEVKGFMGYDDLDSEQGDDVVYYFFLLPESRKKAKEAVKEMVMRREISAVVCDFPHLVEFKYE